MDSQIVGSSAGDAEPARQDPVPVRSATVTATTHMITYAISRQRLRELVAGNVAARDWMLAEMRRRYPNLA